MKKGLFLLVLLLVATYFTGCRKVEKKPQEVETVVETPKIIEVKEEVVEVVEEPIIVEEEVEELEEEEKIIEFKNFQLIDVEIVKETIVDDFLNFEELNMAIDNSLTYFKRLKDETNFVYENEIYTAREVEKSFQLFKGIINNNYNEDPISEIIEKFDIYESKNSESMANFTGYYEPMITISKEKTEEFKVPMYKTPKDLVNVDLSNFSKELIHKKIIGKLDGNYLIPFDTRDEIVNQNSLEGRAEILGYVKDHIELFFIQVQGSGLVKLENGETKIYNYAAKNGHPYRSIGELLKDKIAPNEVNMKSLKEYLYSHKEEVKEILNHNPSYVFFREVEEGPYGYMEVPITPYRTIAMDHILIPKGTLAYVKTKIPVVEDSKIVSKKDFNQFVLVQDTGGAIKGHGRADIFFGNGDLAEKTAGYMKETGRIFLLIAKKEYLKE